MKQFPASLPAKGAYVAAWKRLKSLPDHARVNVSWERQNELAINVKREFAQALQRRINLRGGLVDACDPLPIELVRDARRLEDIGNRVRVYAFESKQCKARFGHLLARFDD